MARRTVLTIVAISFALTLGLSVYLQFAERQTTRPPNRTLAALDSYSDFSWPATPVAPTVEPGRPDAGPQQGAGCAHRRLPASVSMLRSSPVASTVQGSWKTRRTQCRLCGTTSRLSRATQATLSSPATSTTTTTVRPCFWDLRKLTVGDRLQVALQDGSSYTYQVASLAYYDAATAPVGEIVGSTPTETLTLITCGGTFNRRIGDYDKRLVVRAIRVA